MRRRWAVRTVGSVATGILAIALLLAWQAVLPTSGSAAQPAGATAAGTVVAIALLPATARYPQGVLRRAKLAALGAGLGLGVVGFAGYAGVALLPDPLALLATGATLVAVLPVAYERGWRAIAEPRTLVAGDDPAAVQRTAAAIDPSPLGYCAPPSSREHREWTASDRSDPAALRAGRAGAPRPAPASTVQHEGSSDHGLERRAVQQPDGGRVRQSTDGSVRRTVEGSDRRQARATPAAQRSTSLPAPAGTARDVESGREPEPPDAERLGGLSGLDRVVRDRGVDAVVLRFERTDREAFFGALRSCHAAGVDALVPRSGAEPVVLAEDAGSLAESQRAPTESGPGGADSTAGRRGPDGPALEPDGPALAPVALTAGPWYGRLAKRGFDLAFATAGIVALSPLMTVIAIAIRLDSPGPVLYGQWRTGHLGEPFQLLKFRSMVSDAEAASGPRLSDEDAGEVDPRVTRVGRVLRATHLDELPQLFSILVGEMSVVGPRPERPALDAEIAADGVAWRRRWFLTPGLTGLAQINDVTGYHPEAKLAYDLEYADRRSLALDVRIVAIQLGQVAGDVLDLLARRVR